MVKGRPLHPSLATRSPFRHVLCGKEGGKESQYYESATVISPRNGFLPSSRRVPLGPPNRGGSRQTVFSPWTPRVVSPRTCVCQFPAALQGKKVPRGSRSGITCRNGGGRKGFESWARFGGNDFVLGVRRGHVCGHKRLCRFFIFILIRFMLFSLYTPCGNTDPPPPQLSAPSRPSGRPADGIHLHASVRFSCVGFLGEGS